MQRIRRQIKKIEILFFISPKKNPFGILFSKIILKSSSENPFSRKIGKFKIGLNLCPKARWKLCKNNNHNHNRNHNHNHKTKASLYLIFARFVTHFSKILWSYILSWSRLSFYFLHPCKKSNLPSLVDTWILPYFRGLEHKGYIYYFSGCESYLLKRLFFLFVILKPFFGQPKGEGVAYVESLLKEQWIHSVQCACSFEWLMWGLCLKNDVYTLCSMLVPLQGLCWIFALVN